MHIVRIVGSQRWPTGSTHLKDQAVRAADSMVLNAAEGWTRGGQAGRNQLRIARASAGEVLAVFDLLPLPGAAEQQQKLRRVGAMLNKLQQR